MIADEPAGKEPRKEALEIADEPAGKERADDSKEPADKKEPAVGKKRKSPDEQDTEEEQPAPQPPKGPDEDDEVQLLGGTINKRSKKKNKGLRRIKWIQDQIQLMKDSGRWYGSDKLNASDRSRRLQMEADNQAKK